MDFCEENLQLSIRNHMKSNKEKSQFHVKPNAALNQVAFERPAKKPVWFKGLLG